MMKLWGVYDEYFEKKKIKIPLYFVIPKSLAIFAGNSPVPSEFPAQRPVMRSFDVFLDLRPNKWLSKQWWGFWFETLLSYYGVIVMPCGPNSRYFDISWDLLCHFEKKNLWQCIETTY